MKISRLCWLLLTVGLGICCLIRGNILVCSLFLMLLLLPPVTLAISCFGAKKLRVSLECPVNLRKKENGEAVLLVSSRSALPVYGLSCCVTVQNLLTGEKDSIRLTGELQRNGSTRLPVTVSSAFCGKLQILVSKWRVHDCFFLLSKACPLEATGSIVVQPDTFPMQADILPDMADSADAADYSPLRPGWDLSETFQIRDYREGDSPRQIHWKLSSKVDRLVVRDASLPVTRSVLLFWERRSNDETPAQADAAAEILTSLCQSLVSRSGEGISFVVGWNEAGSPVCFLTDIRELGDLIAVLPRMLSAAAIRSGAEPVLQGYAHAVVLDTELRDNPCSGRKTVLLRSEKPAGDAMCYTEQDYRTVLSAIRI